MQPDSVVLANSTLLDGCHDCEINDSDCGFGAVLPNGVSTGLDIGFSNLSYQTITLSFYTMCKSTTPMFLLLFAFLLGLER